MKVIAAVRFNRGRAFVFDEMPEFVYTKYKTCIIGRAGPFFEIYTYAYEKYAKAFAGRKFTLTMHDGEEVHCDGQWWSGVNAEVATIIDLSSIGSVTINTKASLDKCYVFFGPMADKRLFSALVSQYEGITYEYHDYDRLYCSRRRKITKANFRRRKASAKHYTFFTPISLPKYRSQLRRLRNKNIFSKHHP